MGPLEKFLAKWVAKNPEAEAALAKIIGLEKERMKLWEQHKAIRNIGGPQGSKGWEEMSWIHRPDFNKKQHYIDNEIGKARRAAGSNIAEMKIAPWDRELDNALAEYQEGFYEKNPRKWWED